MYFGYSRSAYYDWIETRVKEETSLDLVLSLVRDQRAVHPRMGGKKLHHILKEEIDKLGLKLGRDKFFDLLGSSGLLVKRKKKYAVTTQSFVRFSQFKDHFNGKKWKASHQAWVCDITYIRVGETFQYLFLITDAWSRKVVGWFLGNTLEAKWAVEALKMALRQCPESKGLVHHSDRGFQYCSKVYTTLLKKAGIVSSMGEAGNCYDNAMAERVNGILKTEYLLDTRFNNLNQAFACVKHAVKSYNEKRPHLSLGMGIPAEIHQKNAVFSSLKRKDSPSQKPVKAK